MFGLIAEIVCSMVAEAEARKKWLDSMPKEEADKIRAEDVRIARENEIHRRALEIANAGRARNFWGK